jgi:hypothetical protein
MNKPSVYFNDYVSLAVMLLMIVALVAGQADAQSTTARESARLPLLIQEEWPVDGLEQRFDDRLDIALDGRIGDHAVELSLTVVTESEHFRGEDE